MSSSFRVGQTCPGRVLKTQLSGGVVVELAPGVKGRIPGVDGAPAVTAAPGAPIRVTVVKIDDEGRIVLSPADSGSTRSTASTAAPSRSEGVIRPWSGWRSMEAGHRQAITAMTELRNHTIAFLSALESERRAWEAAKTSSQQTFNAESAAASDKCSRSCRQYKNDCSNGIASTRARKAAAADIAAAARDYLRRLPTAGTDGVMRVLSAGISELESAERELDDAIEQKVRALETLKNCQIADAEKVRNRRLDQLRAEQTERDRLAERTYEANSGRILTNGKKEIREGFNRETILSYRHAVQSTRFDAAHYTCPETIPDFIMLGNIGLSIPNHTQDQISVVQALALQTGEVGEKTGSDEYVVRLPYAQRLSDGISLLMRYSAAERSYAQSLMQPLLLKLFLSFPAGKLEATMIDPLKLGENFLDIPRLAMGPGSARIIDTKCWCREADIELAIATLKQRLENINHAYGDDWESRLRKEPIMALAIADFPQRFTDTALKDLHSIVRNSASKGVCVLICADEAELERLKGRYGTLVDEISKSMVETTVKGRRLMLSGPKNDRLFLELDDMRDVLARKDTILDTISEAIDHLPTPVEPFASMFSKDIHDSRNWFKGTHNEVEIPLGIKGADTVVKMVVGRGGGSTEHHALIAGQTGAGKSTLLHTLIMSAMLSYSPDELQLYLLDFKEGVEFKPYTKYRLPSLRVVALNSEREFGLEVLKELCRELEHRASLFSRYGKSDIRDYSILSGVPKVPRILLVFDEVQELFRDDGSGDSITAQCLSCINKLVNQGRAMGIHLIFACQNFNNCAGLSSYYANMAIRIAIKGSTDGAASILAACNDGINTLQNRPAGYAIYNGRAGSEDANDFFQVSYLSEEERQDLLTRLDAYYSDPIVARRYRDAKTRVLITNAEDDIQNCFNRLIRAGSGSIIRLAPSADGYGILLGQSFGKRSIFMPELQPVDRDNLLMVCRDEKTALSMFILSAMSLLYEELHTAADKTNTLIYCVDLFDDALDESQCDFDFLASRFPRQIKLAKRGGSEALINSLYEIVMGRRERRLSSRERIFLLFFGINRAVNLRSSRLYGDESEDLSPLEKLQKILFYGPAQNVNSIIWGESCRGVQNMLGDRYDALFDKRIAYNLDDASMSSLVCEDDPGSLRGRTAVYMDTCRDAKNTHFRPYDVPARDWVARYAEAYKRIARA